MTRLPAAIALACALLASLATTAASRSVDRGASPAMR